MIPHFNNCMSQSPKKMVTIEINDKHYRQEYVSDTTHNAIVIYSQDYRTNDKITIKVRFNWFDNMKKDYTVSLYS